MQRYNETEKTSNVITGLIMGAILIAAFWAGWHSMNRTLCNRGLPDQQNKQMQLDCPQYQ
jgi:hypothetical protein